VEGNYSRGQDPMPAVLPLKNSNKNVFHGTTKKNNNYFMSSKRTRTRMYSMEQQIRRTRTRMHSMSSKRLTTRMYSMEQQKNKNKNVFHGQ